MARHFKQSLWEQAKRDIQHMNMSDIYIKAVYHITEILISIALLV